MKSPDEVKAFYKSATVNTNPAADATILNDALQAGRLKPKERAAQTEPNIWRAITRSQATRLATAAVLVAAVIIALPRFSEPVVKAVELAEITQAMESVPWMHMSDTATRRGLTGISEQWFGFGTKVHAGKWADGNATFVDTQHCTRYEYDAQSDTITIAYTDYASQLLSSPRAILTDIHRRLERQEAEMGARMGTYRGRKAQIQEISLSIVGQGGRESHTQTLYVDPGAKVLYAATFKTIDADGNVIVDRTITFDYPPAGPKDIYDLGVPANAQIIDKTPKPRSQTIWNEYRRHRTAATDEYVAVITHHSPVDDIVTMVDVNFQSGRKLRQERHFVFHRGEVHHEHWPMYKQQLGDTLASLMAWSRKRYDDDRAHISISLYDGEYDCSTARRNEEDGWDKPDTGYSPERNLGPSTSLGHLAWPGISPTARIVEDDYARQEGLTCIESLGQGRVDPRGWPSLPSRRLRYLDPSRDYICVRQVTEWCPDAEWQKDKDWLAGVDPGKIRQGSIQAVDITETVQAPNGHWYPRLIVEKSTSQRSDYKNLPLKVSSVKTIYLDTSPTFPDGIFDIDKLPGQ